MYIAAFFFWKTHLNSCTLIVVGLNFFGKTDFQRKLDVIFSLDYLFGKKVS